MNNISWDIKVPIFRNGLILKQLGLTIGIPFGLLIAFMLAMKAYYGVILVAALLSLTFIVVMFVFRGTYDLHIEISDYGIKCSSQNKQAERVRRMSILTFVMGVIAKSPTVTGAGLLSGNSMETSVMWADIRKIKYTDKNKTIVVKGGFQVKIFIFCLDDNYETVKKAIASSTKGMKLH